MRWLSLPLALLLLSACDNEKVPPRPEPPAAPKVDIHADTPEPPVFALPETTLEREIAGASNEPPEIQVEIEPVTAGDPEKLPSERVAPPSPKPAAPQAKKKVAVEEVEIPKADLDLSLPDDWATDNEPEQNSASMSLLPPLFGSGESSRSVQMSGTLLPGMVGDDAVIDGAQLNFELKR